MSNILNYLSKKDAVPISREAPLNQLDALALARFSYLPFDEIDLAVSETISSIAAKMQNLADSSFFYPEDKKLILRLSKNPRFADLRVTNFITRLDRKKDEQFAAITIHLPGNKIYVSFIGTDDTISGWREDCNMTIYETVPAQKTARKYLKVVSTMYPLSRIFLGGHSKGGTLAMYAALTVKNRLARRIEFVYSFDAPGLSKKVVEKSNIKATGGDSPLSRMINYVPQDSIIGRLFSHAEEFQVVNSTAKNFYQHNIYSWQVNLSRQELAPATLSKKSDFVDQAISKWLEDASTKQKQRFIDLVFKVLENSKYGTPLDIADDGLRALPEIISSFNKLEKTERKTIFKGLKKLLSAAFSRKN